MTLRESDIRKYLLKCLRDASGALRKVKWIGRNGAPDELILLPGFSCFVELKAPGKKPTWLQKREHEMLRKSGIAVAVIDSLIGVERLVFLRHYD